MPLTKEEKEKKAADKAAAAEAAAAASAEAGAQTPLPADRNPFALDNVRDEEGYPNAADPRHMEAFNFDRHMDRYVLSHRLETATGVEHHFRNATTNIQSEIVDVVNSQASTNKELNDFITGQTSTILELQNGLRSALEGLRHADLNRQALENKITQMSLLVMAHGSSGTPASTTTITGSATTGAATTTTPSGRSLPLLSLAGSNARALGGGFGTGAGGSLGFPGIVPLSLATAAGGAGAPPGGSGFDTPAPRITLPSGPPTHGSGPKDITEKFGNTDKEDWQLFRKSFSYAVILKNYTDPQAKFALYLAMQGAAKLAVDKEDPTDLRDINQMLDRYEEKFMHPAASALAINKFEQAKQQPREELLQFHGRVMQLYSRAHPSLINIEIHPTRVFIAGLAKPQIQAACYRRGPKTFQEVLEVAQQEQSVIDQMNPVAADGRAGYINVNRRDGIHALDPQAIDAMKRDSRCFTCNKRGHIAKDCSMRDKNAKPVRNGDRKFPVRSAGGARVRFSSTKRNKIIAALDAEDSDDDPGEDEGVDEGNSEEDSGQQDEAPAAETGAAQDFS